jgi:UDPglucose 6-dehydrogenase
MKISVIGLGKLGAPLAAVLASKGFPVVGTDLNPALVDAVNAGRAPVDEPRLQELITENRERLRATTDAKAAVAETDVTFVIVPTPSGSDGRFMNTALVEAMQTVGSGLRRKSSYHVVAITSTVMPGSTGGEIRAALEVHSGRRVGDNLGLCYNPEFIALGTVVRDMLSPDMILIGESDGRAGEILERIYERSCDNKPAIRRMNFVNAELTKIAVNTYVTTKISYANMLADICDRLPGADVDAVTQAVGADSRIGAKYLRGAIGYGGPCFPRDNVAFASLARSLGARADLADATDTMNRYQVERVLGALHSRLHGGGTVGILGLSYKPDTAVVEQSQGVMLANRLAEEGHPVVAFDPKALETGLAAMTRPIEAAASAEDCVRRASLVVVMTPWPEFRAIPSQAFARTPRLTVIDCWRLLSQEEIGPVADLVHLGRGATDGQVALVGRHLKLT